MKKSIVIMALLAAAFNANAQITKDRSMLGVRLNISTAHNDNSVQDTNRYLNHQNNSSTNLNTLLSYGYMFTDHLMLGVSGGYTYVSGYTNRVAASGFESTRYDEQGYSAGLFARYYHQIRESKFYLFANLSGSYSQRKNTSSRYSSIDNDYKSTYNTMNVSLYPGLVYMATSKIGLETSIGKLGFTSTSNSGTMSGVKDKGRSNSFSTDLLLKFSSLYIGINFYFGGKKV